MKLLDYKLSRGGVLPEPSYAIVLSDSVTSWFWYGDMLEELLKVYQSEYKANEETLRFSNGFLLQCW